MRRFRLMCLAILVLGMAAVVFVAKVAVAKEFRVTVTAGTQCDCDNPGTTVPCSFQSALTCAQANGEDDTIYVNGTDNNQNLVDATLTYTTPDGDGGHSLTIRPEPGTQPVLRANQPVRILYINTDNNNCCDYDDEFGDVSIVGIAFLNAAAADGECGGALQVATSLAEVTVANCTFANNTVTGNDGGGACIVVGNFTTVVVANSTFANNTAQVANSEGGSGGGLIVETCNCSDDQTVFVVIANNTVYGNTAFNSTSLHGGGGVAVSIEGDMVTLYNNTVYNNTSLGDGGGVGIEGFGVIVNATQNEIYGNRANDTFGGLGITGFVPIVMCKNNRIYNNTATSSAGGVGVIGVVSGFVAEEEEIFSNHVQDGDGGGIVVGGLGAAVRVDRSHIYENTAGEHGGGLALVTIIGEMGARVANNTIYDNMADADGDGDGDGGGVYLAADKGEAFITGNKMYKNKSATGGGMWVDMGDGNLTCFNNLIYLNTARGIGGLGVGGLGDGGGAFLNGGLKTIFLNNSLTQNRAGAILSGGGLYFNATKATGVADIYNNIIYNNTGIGLGADISIHNEIGSTVNLCRNDFTVDHPAAVEVVGELNKNCNIYENPLFNNLSFTIDPGNWDLSLKEDSPCIDAGSNHALTLIDPNNPPTPDEDFAGNPRVRDAVGPGGGTCIVDIGAYEHQGGVNGCDNIDYSELPCCGGEEPEPQPVGPSCTVPSPPKNIKVEIPEGACYSSCSAEVRLSWDRVNKAQGYLIYSASGDLLAWIKSGDTTSYTFSGLSCGRTYRFYLKSHSSCGNSLPSKTVAVELPQCSAGGGTETPAVSLVWPQNNAALDYEESKGFVVFAWNKLSDAKAYLLWISLDDGVNEPIEGSVVLVPGNNLVEAGDLAGIYFQLDENSWNSLVPYTVTWQVSALSDDSDPTSVIGNSDRQSFTFEEASGESN